MYSDSDVPLAQFRTDGYVIDVIKDNTNGDLFDHILRPTIDKRKQFQLISDLVNNSPYLYMDRDDTPIPAILRYVLSNGDVVEITTDGLTALLNGKILNNDEKKELMHAIVSKEISVESKTDPTQPIPVPTLKIDDDPIKLTTISSDLKQKIVDESIQESKKFINSTKAYDHDIEQIDFSEYNHDVIKYAKCLAYYLKYGIEVK